MSWEFWRSMWSQWRAARREGSLSFCSCCATVRSSARISTSPLGSSSRSLFAACAACTAARGTVTSSPTIPQQLLLALLSS